MVSVVSASIVTYEHASVSFVVVFMSSVYHLLGVSHCTGLAILVRTSCIHYQVCFSWCRHQATLYLSQKKGDSTYVGGNILITLSAQHSHVHYNNLR